MATTPNMKFWHVVVYDGYGIVFDKKCLDVKERNETFEVKKEEYPANTPGHEYRVSKEQY